MSAVVERQSAGHAVLFFESDAELVSVAGDRLAEAVLAGAAIVVIATPEHRLSFEERIRLAGVEVEAARAAGLMVELDAADTLLQLMPGGSFNQDAFELVVGTAVRHAAAEHPVQAFGEMVRLLWEDGLVQEAMKLEGAWEVVLQDTSASLLCAYPSTLVDDHAQSAELENVCGLHSSVLSDPPLERTWHFPGDVAVAPAARRLVTNALRARGVSGQTLEDAKVVVAELVANALVHARSPFRVRVSVDGSRVHVQVRDASADVPEPSPLDPSEPSGRGLHLLSALASRWGVERHPWGKLVWAELSR